MNLFDYLGLASAVIAFIAFLFCFKKAEKVERMFPEDTVKHYNPAEFNSYLSENGIKPGHLKIEKFMHSFPVDRPELLALTCLIYYNTTDGHYWIRNFDETWTKVYKAEQIKVGLDRAFRDSVNINEHPQDFLNSL